MRLLSWFLAESEGLCAGWIQGPIVGSLPLLPILSPSFLPFLSIFTKHLMCVSYHQNLIFELQIDLKVNRNITFYRHKLWSQIC